MNTNLRHEKTLFVYSQALENGDFDAVSAIFEQAADDPELKKLLFELDAIYQAEFPVETIAIERLSMSEPQPLHTVSSNGYHSEMPARRNMVRSSVKNRRRIWRVAATIIIVLGAIWLYQTYLTSSDEVYVEVTPRFAQGPITAENLDQLREIRHFGEGGRANGALWTPDGERVVVYGTLGIWIYDADSLDGEPISTIDTDSAINDADLNADGTLLATAQGDGTVRVYNLATGTEELSIHTNESGVALVAFSPDGQLIASGGDYKDPSIALWSSESGRKVLAVGESLADIGGLVFSENGARLAWAGLTYVPNASPDGGSPFRPSITVLDLTTRESRTFASGGRLLDDFALSPDGNIVVAVVYDVNSENRLEPELRVWNIEEILGFSTPEPRTVLFKAGFEAIRSSETGDLPADVVWGTDSVVSVLHSGTDLAISEWSIDTLEVVQVLSLQGTNSSSPNRNTINARRDVTYSPNKERVLVTDGDGSIFLIDLVSQENLVLNQNHSSFLQRFALNSSASMLAIGNGNIVTIWDMDGGTVIAETEDDIALGDVSELQFFPNDETIAIAHSDLSNQSNRSLALWTIASNELRFIASPRFESNTLSVDVNSDSTKLAYITWDETIWLYNAESGGSINLVSGDSTSIRFINNEQVRFEPDDDGILAYTIGDTFIHIITNHGDEIVDLTGNSGTIQDFAFSPDGRFLASVNDDGYMLIWETETWDELAYMNVGEAHSVAFSADGSMIAVGGEQDITFWDVETESLVGTVEGHTSQVSQLVFSADGELLVSLSRDGTVRLWAVE